MPEYELLDLIGHGGMGLVYRARQVSLDREVALKLLPRDFAGDTVLRQRFRREVMLLSRLSQWKRSWPGTGQIRSWPSCSRRSSPGGIGAPAR